MGTLHDGSNLTLPAPDDRSCRYSAGLESCRSGDDHSQPRGSRMGSDRGNDRDLGQLPPWFTHKGKEKGSLLNYPVKTSRVAPGGDSPRGSHTMVANKRDPRGTSWDAILVLAARRDAGTAGSAASVSRADCQHLSRQLPWFVGLYRGSIGISPRKAWPPSQVLYTSAVMHVVRGMRHDGGMGGWGPNPRYILAILLHY